MSTWEQQLMEAADNFFADAIPGYRAWGVQRPSEFWVDKLHDAVYGGEG